MMHTLLIFPDPLTATCLLQHDAIPQPIVGVPATHPTGRPGKAFTIPDGTPNGHGARVDISAPGKVRIDQKGVLQLRDDGTADLEVDDFRLQDLPAAPGPTPEPGDTVGCIDGYLKDPVAWFFDLIGRKKGQPADDWFTVLSSCGLEEGVGPGVQIPIPDPEKSYGIRLMVGAGGPRGRWFTASSTRDANGYYTEEHQCIAEDPSRPGHLIWTDFITSRGTYLAHPCK